jgi:hypothetical protein
VDVAGLPTILASVTTDSNGMFSRFYQIDVADPLGTTNLWVSCTPTHSYVSPGVSSAESIQIELIPVNLEANVDTAFAYIGDSLVFSGTLTFGNLTAMDGYSVMIYWTAPSLPPQNWSRSTEPSGYFEYTFTLPWDHSVGDSSFYVEFQKPNDAYVDNQTIIQFVEIWDRVDIVLDSDIITVSERGRSVDITGTVVNFGSQSISDILVTLLIDGNISVPSYEDVTDENGHFSLSYLVPSITEAGYYIFSVNISTYYYELNQSESRNITIKLRSHIHIDFDNSHPIDRNSRWIDLMSGEHFNISVQLTDENGDVLIDRNMEIYLNDTLVHTAYISGNETFHEIQVIIPSSWALSGIYHINITYSGAELLLPTFYDWTVGDDDIHIFTDIAVSITGDTVVLPETAYIISGILIDDQGVPIASREVSIIYNDTEYHPVTTDENGVFSYPTLPITNITGDYEYSIIFYSETGNQILGPFTLTVRAGGGAVYEPLAIVLWIGVIAVELAAAFVLITRKRRSYSRLSSQFHPKIGILVKNIQRIMIRWL